MRDMHGSMRPRVGRLGERLVFLLSIVCFHSCYQVRLFFSRFLLNLYFALETNFLLLTAMKTFIFPVPPGSNSNLPRGSPAKPNASLVNCHTASTQPGFTEFAFLHSKHLRPAVCQGRNDLSAKRSNMKGTGYGVGWPMRLAAIRVAKGVGESHCQSSDGIRERTVEQ